MRLMDDPDGSEAMNGFAARRVEDLGAIATALHLAGGPWAARRVAGIVCGEPQGSRVGAALEHCLGDDAGWVRRMPAARWNRLGTLVTASGYLAGDAHQAWRDLACASRSGHSADCRTGPGQHVEEGRMERSVSRDATVLSAIALERALASIVWAEPEQPKEQTTQPEQPEEQKTQQAHAHSLSNRRAACTALGLSGGGDKRGLEWALHRLLLARDTEVLPYCLGHAPVNLSETLREELQSVVKGCWPARIGANDGTSSVQAPCSDPPPTDLRVSALAELYEAGLYFDDETVYAALHSPDAKLRNAAAKFLEDVDSTRMAERLWKCAQPWLSSRVEATGAEANGTEATGFAATPEGKRCLRAWPLLARSEDGDGFYADAMARQLDSAGDDVKRLICNALAEMAARGDRAAEKKLGERNGVCRSRQNESSAEMPDARKRWEANLEMFRLCDNKPDIAQCAGDGAKPDSGSQRDNALKIVRDQTKDFDARVLAFLQLTQTAAELGIIPVYDLLVEPPSTALSYLAGQYLEDTTQTAVEVSLLECANDAKTEMPIRQRCVIGLAMTRAGYRVPDGSVDALWGGPDAPGLQPVACRLAAEMLARQQEIPASSDCASRLPSLPEEATDRWQAHRQALLKLLIDQRIAHGPYKDETQSFHEEQLALLEAQGEP